MAEFTVNADRLDPYQNLKFRVIWDGSVIAGISKISALKRTTNVIEHRDGGDTSTSRQSPGETRHAPITLERGVTHDLAFEAWANKVFSQRNEGVSLKDFRKDIIIQLLNEAGQVVIAYQVFRCWVSDYQAVPELDSNGRAIAIETLVLQNEGWTRDLAVQEPQEPRFD